LEVIAGYDDVLVGTYHFPHDQLKRIDLYTDSEVVLQHVLNQTNLHDTPQGRYVHGPGQRKLVRVTDLLKNDSDSKDKNLFGSGITGRLSMRERKGKNSLYRVEFAE
jgi:hypothetical protein